MSRTFDAIIVGGGVIGTASAYELALRGVKVALIERTDIADGTGSHTDGFVIFADKQPGVDALQGTESIRIFKEQQKTFEYDMELENVGFTYTCETEREMEEATKYAEKVTEQGAEMFVIDSKELVEHEPNISPHLLGGLYSTTQCLGTPYKIAFSYAHEAKKLGTEIFTHTNVTGIKRNADGSVAGVETTDGDFLAPAVINCAGVWAPELGRMVGIDIPIEPRKGIILITEKTAPITTGMILEFGYYLTKFFADDYHRPVHPLVEKHNIALNMATTPSGNTTVGGCRLFRGYDIRSEYEIYQAIALRSVSIFPILKDINCIRGFGGIRPYSLDRLPIVGAVPEVPGYFIAAGHEGDGIALAAITGRLLAQNFAGEELEFPEAEELHWTRFADFTPEQWKAIQEHP
ncbi:MAG: FAD-binding oxidoreductase [Clostridiales Family XIII bacterium]|jgi:sarcosine oxidase subunit beta|nr:FAD-binding oxidoreductase [Clostridiales Family XIII bacterium]